MYQSVLDVEHALLIGLFSGSTNVDADYQRYIDSIVEADRQKLAKPGGIAVLVVERGNPIPSAQWRKRIADATGDLATKNVLFILCSGDPLMRGVAIAINWLRPPKYELAITSSITEMLDVIRARRPAVLARAEEMIRTLQAGVR